MIFTDATGMLKYGQISVFTDASVMLKYGQISLLAKNSCLSLQSTDCYNDDEARITADESSMISCLS